MANKKVNKRIYVFLILSCLLILIFQAMVFLSKSIVNIDIKWFKLLYYICIGYVIFVILYGIIKREILKRMPLLLFALQLILLIIVIATIKFYIL
ncbi:hypothetical protein [Anaerosphaera multitolerans]|uniref:Uncharacterized protein n=1 Tax=Anaerosphaera multitolerans TaxID=2487351 RepID=A0A437SA13_9FIRM|nr:hypothetical protein [Anaerosphaera multitolerans]RVU55638.1 hypothetical protein EF514_00025 [Anaerosphaera multitolerans]